MQNLYDTARSDGITVPIFHNDKGRNGIWVPAGSNVPGTVTGPNDLYAFDGYPGGTCNTNATPGSPSTAPDWGIWGPGGATGGSSASPNTPGFAAEFGGGWFDYWGSQGTYDCTAQREGPGYERVFYGTNIANRLTIQNFYMTFGGTSWGWLPAPVVYTSYDYGAAINEARQLRPKASTMKEIGLFLQSVAPVITKVDKGAGGDARRRRRSRSMTTSTPTPARTSTSPMHNPSNATTDDSVHLPDQHVGRHLHRAAAGDTRDQRPGRQDARRRLRHGRPAPRLLDLGDHDPLRAGLAGRRAALRPRRRGRRDRAALREPADREGRVRAASTSTYDAATGDLRLDYVHNGLAEVRISGGGRPPLTLLLADNTTAGRVLAPGHRRRSGARAGAGARADGVGRRADARAHRRHERRDHDEGVGAAAACAPAPGTAGRPRSSTDRGRTAGGQRRSPAPAGAGAGHAARPVDGPVDATRRSRRRRSRRSTTRAGRSPTRRPPTAPPSRRPGSRCSPPTTTASTRATSGTARPTRAPAPATTPDDALRRRRRRAAAGLARRRLPRPERRWRAAWRRPPTTGTATFTIPTGTAHRWAAHAGGHGPQRRAQRGRRRQRRAEGGPRPHLGARSTDADQAAVNPQITWRIQGNLGGEDIADPARGVENNGGLYGERHGWYLPGYPDGDWSAGDGSGEHRNVGHRVVPHHVQTRTSPRSTTPRSASRSVTRRRRSRRRTTAR